MGKLTIEILPIFSDNYVYLLRDAARGVTGVVDPGDAAPVLARLDETGWKLDWILSTHHHQDHTAGNVELKRRTGKSHDVGDWPDRFRASEDVGAGVREKLMGVEKIRTAKHVKDDWERLRRVGEIVDFPVTDANELARD